jgi:hypothetical protein
VIEPLPLPLEPLELLDEPEPFEPLLLLGCVLEPLPLLLLLLGCEDDGTGLLLTLVVPELPVFHGVQTSRAITIAAAAIKPRIAIIMVALMPAATAASSLCPWS